jgi:hypothetical protein
MRLFLHPAQSAFLLNAPLAYRLGHFYSPICGRPDLDLHYCDPRNSTAQEIIHGIDLNEQAQRALWGIGAPTLREFSFPDAKATRRSAQPTHALLRRGAVDCRWRC